MSDDFQTEIAFLGIEASPSFVREPEGNGVAERFIRTLKAATYRRTTPKLGRNDPCSCGSGKKNKQCCGKVTLH